MIIREPSYIWIEICAISYESVFIVFVIESRLEDVFPHDVEYAALKTDWLNVQILDGLKFASHDLRDGF